MGSMGLWIDLVNSNRYYNPDSVRRHGINYVKIHCDDRGYYPTESQVSKFCEECEDLLRMCPDMIIGVHCTHGFNRTGFMITSYLVLHRKWNIEMAIAKFAQVRSPGIFRQDFIDELLRRFDTVGNYVISAPLMPHWTCCGPVIDDEDDPIKVKCSKKQRSGNMKAPVDIIKLAGVNMLSDRKFIVAIQTRIQELCYWKNNSFPGCKSTRMSLQKMMLLSRDKYRMTWRSEGTRYLLYIDDREIFLADENLCIYEVKGILFPTKSSLSERLISTLLDGELVMDREDTGEITPRFYISDVIRINGKCVMNFYHDKRSDMIVTDIITPRLDAMEYGLINTNEEPFQITKKDSWLPTYKNTARLCSENFKKDLLHRYDGLCFKPYGFYLTGVWNGLLHWNPPVLEPVYFKVKIVITRQMLETAELYASHLKVPFAFIEATGPVKKEDGNIIQCIFHNKQWIFLKGVCDMYTLTEAKVAKDIANYGCLTKELLLDFINEVDCDHPFSQASKRMKIN